MGWEDRRVSMEIGTDENPQHWHEEIGEDVGNRLNWLGSPAWWRGP